MFRETCMKNKVSRLEQPGAGNQQVAAELACISIH
jgi:hypothetical protein